MENRCTFKFKLPDRICTVSQIQSTPRSKRKQDGTTHVYCRVCPHSNPGQRVAVAASPPPLAMLQYSRLILRMMWCAVVCCGALWCVFPKKTGNSVVNFLRSQTLHGKSGRYLKLTKVAPGGEKFTHPLPKRRPSAPAKAEDLTAQNTVRCCRCSQICNRCASNMASHACFWAHRYLGCLQCVWSTATTNTTACWKQA